MNFVQRQKKVNSQCAAAGWLSYRQLVLPRPLARPSARFLARVRVTEQLVGAGLGRGLAGRRGGAGQAAVVAVVPNQKIALVF